LDIVRIRTVRETRPIAASRGARFLNALLVLLALAYLGYAISSHVQDLRTATLSVGAADIAGFVVLGMASIALSTLYHVMLVSTLVPHRLDDARLAMAYAVGQIVRYLPGKVMGLLFQANVLRGEVPTGTIALALLVQMVLAYCCAGAIAVAILGAAWIAHPWPLALLAPAAALLWHAQRAAWTQRALRCLPYIGRRLGGTAGGVLPRSRTSALALTLFANWVPFLAGWAWLLRDTHTFAQSMVFAAVYLAASIASTAMIVVPSGIVVREAIFIWLGARYGIPMVQLLFYAALARLALTAADALNALIFYARHALGAGGTR
jgi:hypothetical protein